MVINTPAIRDKYMYVLPLCVNVKTQGNIL